MPKHLGEQPFLAARAGHSRCQGPENGSKQRLVVGALIKVSIKAAWLGRDFWTMQVKTLEEALSGRMAPAAECLDSESSYS